MGDYLRQIATVLDRMDGYYAAAFYLFLMAVVVGLLALVVMFFIERSDLKKEIKKKNKTIKKLKECCNSLNSSLDYYEQMDYERVKEGMK